MDLAKTPIRSEIGVFNIIPREVPFLFREGMNFGKVSERIGRNK
jgi:hypothetical protein